MAARKNNSSLSKTHPEIASEAAGWDPSLFSKGSEAKLEWRCHKDHIWVATVKSRVRGVGCSICDGRQLVPGVNDLGTTHPKLAKQAHEWDPRTITVRDGRHLDWTCERGHVWSAKIWYRLQGTNCPYCSGNKVLSGFNDLLTKLPSLAKEADGWNPATVSTMSSKKMNWKCDKGHRWKASISSRSAGSGCPICSGRNAFSGFNDLSTTHPDLAQEVQGCDPKQLRAGSHKKIGWKCASGHQWVAQVKSRVAGRGCPYCAGKKPLSGFNDLLTTEPLLSKELVEANPNLLTRGSNKKVRWRCPLGHQWQATVVNRAVFKQGCPICAGKQILDGFNDLATTHPELAGEADGWDPKTVTAQSGRVLRWKCKLGHIHKARVAQRTYGGRCPVCLNRTVLKGFNDLATTHPELAREAEGWDPQTVSYGSRTKHQWKCEEGHSWRATVLSRTTGTGCPTCSKGGYDPNQPGFLYFLENLPLELLQIGITNDPRTRISQHEKRDWTCLEIKGPTDGHWVQATETAALQSLSRAGALFANKIHLQPFDGYSESWLKSSYPVRSLKEILDLVHQMESEELEDH